MAYTWEPRWEPMRFESNGIIITTCRDKVTGLIACPICLNADATCNSKNTHHSDTRGELSFFFSIDDLIEHIRVFHGRGLAAKIEEIRKRMGEKTTD
ncbi:MAG: hypothetical protein QXF49_02290 [Thermosphaera sp.]